MSALPSVDPSGQVAPAPPVLGADAAQRLFERHSGAIYAYCLNRLGRREEAEDAVQSTFLNAFGALRRGVVPEFEAAWLYKIAENVCRGRHRSAGRRLEIVQDPTVIEEAVPAAESRRDELVGLDEALGRMAPRQRRALLLREWQGLSYREIAQELRLTPGAVETLLFRARRSLARNLQVGSLLPWLKSLLGGSAAVKTAVAAGVVVASASLGGGGPVEPKARPAPQERAAKVAKTNVTPSTPPGKVVAPRVSETPARVRLTPSGQADAAERPSAPRRSSLPVGSPTIPASDTPAPAPAPTSPAATPPGAPPPAPPAAPIPTPPPASLPIEIPPPTPQLPALPGLPSLLPPPSLPPAPQLPAPQLPTPQLPGIPELPALPQLPQLPPLPQLP